MRFPWKIVANPQLPKLDRKLELEHFHTFKNGHEIFTYKIEDLTHISGRYLDQVKSTINFMLQYNAGPDQIKAFVENICKALLLAIKEPDPVKKDEYILQALEAARQMPELRNYVEDLESKVWYDLYVMFFVLDSEDELTFTPAENAKKIEYLETCTIGERERFFFHLKGLMISFSDTYKNDTLNSLIKEGEMLDLVESLLHPTRTANFSSSRPVTQE